MKIEIHGYGSGHFKRLEGRVMTLLESLGLGSSQEKAIKDLMRNEIWTMWDNPSFDECKEVEFPTAVLEGSSQSDDDLTDLGKELKAAGIGGAKALGIR